MGLEESEGEIIKTSMIQNEAEELAKFQNNEFEI